MTVVSCPDWHEAHDPATILSTAAEFDGKSPAEAKRPGTKRQPGHATQIEAQKLIHLEATAAVGAAAVCKILWSGPWREREGAYWAACAADDL